MSVVYVDKLFFAVSKKARRVGERNGHQWCHMWSEDVEALHVIAKKIGMKRAWFQDKPGFPHYDLTPGKRKLAVAAGAVEISLIEWKRDKIKSEEPERRVHVDTLLQGLNPMRKEHGLPPVVPKKLLGVLQQTELDMFLTGATAT